MVDFAIIVALFSLHYSMDTIRRVAYIIVSILLELKRIVREISIYNKQL